MVTMKKTDLTREIAVPSQTGLRSVWQWRPLATLTPAMVVDILRRAAMGDAHDFLLAADDVKEKDLHYRAVLQTRVLAVAGLPWSIQPADTSSEAKRAADIASEALMEIDIAGLIAHLMDAVAKGYAVAEIVWETSDRLWRPRAILPRDAHWFTFDRDSGRLLRLIDGSADGAEIPPYRMIMHFPPLASGIPLLGGVARSALWAWVFKSYALRNWARFIEIFGQPIRVGKYHDSATPDDVAVLKQAVFNMGSDAAAVIPVGMMIEFAESSAKSASADLYQRMVDYMDRQVSKAVLGQTMTTDDGSSLAQARVHQEVRYDLMRADARAVAATLTRDLIAPIVRLNLGEAAPPPKLVLEFEEPDDRTALADQIERLARAGVAIPQGWVRQKFGIPEPEPGEDVVAVTGAVSSQSRVVHTHTKHYVDPTPVTAMSDRLEIEAEPAWREIMQAVQQIVNEAESLADLRDQLLAAYGSLPTEKLAKVMALAMAAAELAGHLDVELESG